MRPIFALARPSHLAVAAGLVGSLVACKSKDAATEVASAADQASAATDQAASAAEAVGKAAEAAKGAAAGPAAPADVAAIPSTAKTLASGIGYRTLQAGSGQRHPGPTDRVKVHYSGWTTDGKLFDSSVARGTPATFGLNQVIRGWTEGLQQMVEGERARLWIPSSLAYNNEPGRPMGMLVFDVELLQIL